MMYCKYLIVVKGYSCCPYKEAAQAEGISRSFINLRSGKHKINEYVAPKCPEDAMKNNDGQFICWRY